VAAEYFFPQPAEDGLQGPKGAEPPAEKAGEDDADDHDAA